jgi:histidinol phosphatase-like PHP family hydrolase
MQIPEVILPELVRLGIKRVGFADHVWANPDLLPNEFYRPQNINRIERLREQLKSVPNLGIEILVGCEAEMLAPDKFAITPEIAQRLDIVVLATDHFHFKGIVEQPKTEAPRDIGVQMLKLFIGGAKCKMATTLAHPMLPLGFMQHYDAIIDSLSDNEMFDAFSVAAQTGVAWEITLSYFPDQAKNRYHSIETPLRVLSIAKQAGCKFVFGSDAHTIQRLGRIHELSFFVDKLGLNEGNIHKLGKC